MMTSRPMGEKAAVSRRREDPESSNSGEEVPGGPLLEGESGGPRGRPLPDRRSRGPPDFERLYLRGPGEFQPVGGLIRKASSIPTIEWRFGED